MNWYRLKVHEVIFSLKKTTQNPQTTNNFSLSEHVILQDPRLWSCTNTYNEEKNKKQIKQN